MLLGFGGAGPVARAQRPANRYVRQTISAGGAYHTSVLAYEFYFQAFKAFNSGLSAALAVLIFVLVLPIVIYNVRQMRKAEAR